LVQISHLHRSKSTYKFTFLRIQKRERIQSELIESEIETKYIELMERIQPPEPPLSNQLSIDRTPSDESILQSPTQESNEVKIKDRIPPHHPIKILKDKLDLDEMVKCFTKKFGRGIIRRLPVPIDVLIRMMIILIIYNLRSERELMVKLPMRLDWMWFLGYEWGGKLPKTKSLVISRKYMGEEAFMELFTISFIHLVESRLLNGNVLFLNTFSAKNYNKSYLKVKYTNSDIYLKYEEFIQKLEYPKKNTKSLLVRFSDNMFQVRKNLETKGRCESAD
jgi:transposase